MQHPTLHNLNNKKQKNMTTYTTLEKAILDAKNKTGALRVTQATDGVNLVVSGFDFFGNTCFNIYKTYCNQYTKKFIVRYTNI